MVVSFLLSFGASYTKTNQKHVLVNIHFSTRGTHLRSVLGPLGKRTHDRWPRLLENLVAIHLVCAPSRDLVDFSRVLHREANRTCAVGVAALGVEEPKTLCLLYSHLSHCVLLCGTMRRVIYDYFSGDD